MTRMSVNHTGTSLKILGPRIPLPSERGILSEMQLHRAPIGMIPNVLSQIEEILKVFHGMDNEMKQKHTSLRESICWTKIFKDSVLDIEKTYNVIVRAGQVATIESYWDIRFCLHCLLATYCKERFPKWVNDPLRGKVQDKGAQAWYLERWDTALEAMEECFRTLCKIFPGRVIPEYFDLESRIDSTTGKTAYIYSEGGVESEFLQPTCREFGHTHCTAYEERFIDKGWIPWSYDVDSTNPYFEPNNAFTEMRLNQSITDTYKMAWTEAATRLRKMDVLHATATANMLDTYIAALSASFYGRNESILQAPPVTTSGMSESMTCQIRLENPPT